MTDANKSRRMRVFKAINIILSVFLSLVMLELGLRAFWLRKMTTIGSGSADSHFHHRFKPNTDYHYKTSEFDVAIHTNRFGLRGPDPLMPKPKNLKRILLLGDSVTFGFPIKDEEVFARLLESGLKEKGINSDVVNCAHSGYSTVLSYIRLRDECLAFDPDVVVLMFDLGDVWEDHQYQKNLKYSKTGELLAADSAIVDGRFSKWQWLVDHSAIARWFNNKPLVTYQRIQILGLKEYLKAKLRGERAKTAIARLKAKEQSKDIGRYDRFVLVRETSTKELVQPAWELSAKYLKMIKELLDKRGIAFVLGVYPYGMNVSPTEWGKGRRFWGFETGRVYDPGLARSLYREFSNKEGVMLVDTFDSFVKAAGKTSEPLFFDKDGHPTAAGHKVIAEHLLNDGEFLSLIEDTGNKKN
jgi:lysophospholipase L1-like esterase